MILLADIQLVDIAVFFTLGGLWLFLGTFVYFLYAYLVKHPSGSGAGGRNEL